MASLISQGRPSGGKHRLLTISRNAWHHYRSTAIPFSFIPPESALDERSAATHECSEALKQIAGSTLSVLDISGAPRAHTQLREGSRDPLYKGRGAAQEHRNSEKINWGFGVHGEKLSEATVP